MYLTTDRLEKTIADAKARLAKLQNNEFISTPEEIRYAGTIEGTIKNHVKLRESEASRERAMAELRQTKLKF